MIIKTAKIDIMVSIVPLITNFSAQHMSLRSLAKRKEGTGAHRTNVSISTLLTCLYPSFCCPGNLLRFLTYNSLCSSLFPAFLPSYT